MRRCTPICCPGQRARLHAAVAHAIERRPDLVADGTREHEVALHWSRSGDHERTFAAAVRATRAQTGAHAETLAMYERVLELWDLVPEPERTAGPRLSVLTEAARAARDAGEFGRAIDLFTAAIDETGPDDVPGRIERLFQRAQLMSDALRVGGDRDVEEAEELLATVDDPTFRARMLTRLATYRLNVGLDALPRGQEAVEASRLVGDRAGEADARTTLGTAMVAAGLDEPGLEELRLAREAPLTGVRPPLRNLLNTSDALHLMGRYEEAIDMALQGLSEARALGVERAFGTYLVGNAAESMLATGEWSRAADLLADAVTLDPPSSHRTHLDLLLAWLHVWRDEPDLADEVLAEHRALMARRRRPADAAVRGAADPDRRGVRDHGRSSRVGVERIRGVRPEPAALRPPTELAGGRGRRGCGGTAGCAGSRGSRGRRTSADGGAGDHHDDAGVARALRGGARRLTGGLGAGASTCCAPARARSIWCRTPSSGSRSTSPTTGTVPPCAACSTRRCPRAAGWGPGR